MLKVMLVPSLILLCHTVCKRHSINFTRTDDPLPILHAFYQPGDLVIGGIVSQVFSLYNHLSFMEQPAQTLLELLSVPKNYQHVLALAFAVKEINENPHILPNISLGFHILNSYYTAKMTFKTTLNLLSTQNKHVPNYKCHDQTVLIAITGGCLSEISANVAILSAVWKIPQMVPNEAPQYMGVVQLLQHFGWTWIGLCAVDDDKGQRFLQTMVPMLSQNLICDAFILRIPNWDYAEQAIQVILQQWKSYNTVIDSNANLHHFLSTILFNNNAGDMVHFNENGELVTQFDVTNWLIFPNGSMARVKIGSLDPQAPVGHALTTDDDQIRWHTSFNQVVPISMCNDPCYPGYSRKKKEQEKFCCYDCAPCPEGTISHHNGTNIETDQPCPNPLDSALVYPKTPQFPNQDIMGRFFKGLAEIQVNHIPCISSIQPSQNLFVEFHKPGKVTCLLRQTVFSTVFSVALSSILAKTITVLLAFVVTKPGSRMRKRMEKGLANSISLSGSLIQAAICAFWLSMTPPFPDVDMHSLDDQIILECNQGSAPMFYCVLGYLGSLAIVSFSVAFLARKLPDAFNEAKFITFSMLVFCRVWLSFVPAYLSTTGKYLVAMEIFAILSFSAGLLGCIFGPKCYITVVRPELNNREQLIRRKK
ncbi:hypothetical protein EYD10_15326 [Varanus komodoensis]|nr:hypothetical protein EYD10_15326 [Varanus komodoensis]